MTIITGAQAAVQSDDDHRDDHDGEGDVRNQDCEVNRSPDSPAEKKNVAGAKMEIKVAGEKQRRGGYGRDHAGAMRGHASAGDHVAAGNEKYGAGSVQACIQGGEESVLFSDHILTFIILAIIFWRSSGGPRGAAIGHEKCESEHYQRK